MSYKAALYCRISKDDDNTGDSTSITTQKKMLQGYCKEQEFSDFEFYIDDGFSGTDFERPAFKRMISDIRSGKINLVITKDLSRLGRDYIVSGHLIEDFFPKHRIRYIALNDGYDSIADGSGDLVAIRNVMNEFYARDISRKIKSAIHTRMLEGKYIGSFAPYGYKKSEKDKNKLVINKETADVVKMVFELALSGDRPSDIAKKLNSRKIAPPSVYRLRENLQSDKENEIQQSEWTSGAIQRILKNKVYTGCTVQHKTSKISFKNKKSVYTDPKDRIVVKNTHEAIINPAIFEIVGKQIVARRNPPKSGFKNVFSGIAYCGSCGAHMSLSVSGRILPKYKLVCGKYKLGGKKKCSSHSVDYNELLFIIREEIKRFLNSDSNIETLLNENTDRMLFLALVDSIIVFDKKNNSQAIEINFKFSL